MLYFLKNRGNAPHERQVVLGQCSLASISNGFEDKDDFHYWTSDGWFSTTLLSYASPLFVNPGASSLSCIHHTRFGYICLMADYLNKRIVARTSPQLFNDVWSEVVVVLSNIAGNPIDAHWHLELSPDINQTLFFTFSTKQQNFPNLVRIDLYNKN